MQKSFIRSYFRSILLCFTIIGTGSACKKLVTIPPPSTELVSTNVYSSNASAAAVLTGIYERIMQSSSNFATTNTMYNGLGADELQNFSLSNSTLEEFYNNALVSTNVPFWDELYQYIYTANAALDGVAGSEEVTTSVKTQLTGEAKFLRAFCCFYLTNLFGDVPLIITTNYQVNDVASRTPQSQVYQQIIADLKDAQQLLSPNFLGPDAQTVVVDRVRPTKWAAAALLSRVYLYTGDWVDAESEADTVIDNTAGIALQSSLNSVFLKNSSEAIWQLEPVLPGYNTFEGNNYILSSAPNSSHPVSLSSYLSNSFESGDNRDTAWVGRIVANGQTYHYSLKYKTSGATNSSVTEYLMVLRLAEQYLIRAEAEANLKDMVGAAQDLNTIRARAGLGASPTLTASSNLQQADSAILHERQVELFCEWGHRWLDLKRTNTVSAILGAEKTNWSADAELYPIPVTESQNDPNLSQNPGY